MSTETPSEKDHPSFALSTQPRKVALIFEPTGPGFLVDFPEVCFVTDEKQREACTVFFDSLFISTEEGTGDEGYHTIVLGFDLTHTPARDLQLPLVCELSPTAGLAVAALIHAKMQEEAGHDA